MRLPDASASKSSSLTSNIDKMANRLSPVFNSQLGEESKQREKYEARCNRNSDVDYHSPDEAGSSFDDSDSASDLNDTAESHKDSGYSSLDEDSTDNEAEFYDAYIAECEVDGPTMANHGPKTLKALELEKRKWLRYKPNLEINSNVLSNYAIRFCKQTKKDPDASLQSCKAPIYKGYMHWRVKHSRIKKESSIMCYWNWLSMIYANETKKWMDGAVLYDVGNVRDVTVGYRF